ncbi:MAG TPA: aminomethyl-transferring glycine dehydrogenase subunit GcvPA [Gammaproteobacteria bacterium]
MPFIPHTENDVQAMLAAIGINSIDELFDEIPGELRIHDLPEIPAAINEMEITRLMYERAARDQSPLCFIGAGAYEHHIPAAVWQVATRGEFYSSYTPYQAEASQGTLQLIYEYQTMMTGLTGMDVSNASLYDGASALSEAVLMGIRANRKSRGKRILMPTSVNPVYRACTHGIVKNQGVELIEVPYSRDTGLTALEALERHDGEDIAALVVQQPNFFGSLEEVDALTDWAHANNALLIAVVNPMALAVLKPPGQWGGQGADIACGDGQPLGAPLSSGGPYYGFMCCKEAHVRQMPGRIVGRTVDADGRQGFVLTLQAREQHIRRSKATSNICTNQGLVVTASTIYMAIMGPEGLFRTAAASHANTRTLLQRLVSIAGVERVFAGPFFHEAVLRLNRPVQDVLAAMADEGVLGGYALGKDYPELGEALLVCATETKTEADLDRYAAALSRALSD